MEDYFDSHFGFKTGSGHLSGFDKDLMSTTSTTVNPLNPHNLTVELGFEFENDDSAWIMACVFIIFTMQTGNFSVNS